ncbi:uncharacterized protein LOC115209932 isoform X2 [Octopus sinensis]|uniref:Uncharacterized protein LOC115209932 isoform X2 n=1 Tax=Octopus sinensis TaxID=2607531 RepID=A0A6P7S7V3_9MOLL|nr:uncharacterized protein LOC115209932 isoform X2 [Octopus sinensis]
MATQESQNESSAANIEAHSTKRAEVSACEKFGEYIFSKGEKLRLHQLLSQIARGDMEAKHRLKNYLCSFFPDLRKDDGTWYKHAGLRGIRYGLYRFILKRGIDILNDPYFLEANRVWQKHSYSLQQKFSAIGNAKSAITLADLQKAYSWCNSDLNNPNKLQKRVFMDIVLFFGRNGYKCLSQLTKHHFRVNKDQKSGLQSIILTDGIVNTGENIPTELSNTSCRMIHEVPNEALCPVKIFANYLSRLHPQSDKFFCQPRFGDVTNSPTWYTLQPHGGKSIANFMREISSKAHLSHSYTNQCLRATLSSLIVSDKLDLKSIQKVITHQLPGPKLDSVSSEKPPIDAKQQHFKRLISADSSLSGIFEHFVGGNGPTRDHPDPLPVRPMNVLHSSGGYIDAGPSNQVYSGKPENPRRKKIAAATVSSAPVLIPDDSPPQPSPAKIQKKQIDDRRFDEQRFQEQRFQERRFENRRFDDRRQMVNTQVSQMAAKTLQAQMPVQQHMSVAQVSQNITRPVQVLAPPIQISEPKPKPVEKPRPREKRIFVVADHQRCVMSNLASLWKSGKLCDAGIGNGSSTVMVHKVVLSAVCPKLLSVFSTDILSHKFLQVNFPEEVSTEALNAFAEYMYNGLLDIDPDILHQLKIIAKRLDMKEFEQLCDSRLPSTIPHQPASTVTVFGDLSQMQTILSNPPSITVPTVQPSLPSSSITSVSSHSTPSVTTQVIDVKQEISEAELAQVKKDTAAVFGQESEVASLDASKSGNSSGGFVIVPSVKTEPVGPEDDRYGQLNNQSYTSTPVSISSRIPGTGLNSTVVSSSEFVLPFSDTTDSNTTNVLQGTSKLKSNVFESSLVSDLSPVSCIVEKMCSQSSPIREDPSKPLNRTITTQSIDNIVTSGSNEGVYPVGLFTAGGDSLPLSSSQVTSVKNIGLYKTDGLT